MKLRIYPKKDTVLALLNSKIKNENDLIDDANTKLAKLNESTLFMGDHHSRETMYKQAIIRGKDHVEHLEMQKTLLANHDPPEVAVEIEL